MPLHIPKLKALMGPKMPKVPGMGQVTPKSYTSLPPSVKGPTVGAVTPVGPLASLKEHEEKEMRTSAPLSTEKGFKESLTKKTRPKI